MTDIPFKELRSKRCSFFFIQFVLFLSLLHIDALPARAKTPGNLLQAQISLGSNWNYKDQHEQGSLNINIHGKLELNRKFSSTEQGMPAVMLPYKAVSMQGKYSYKDVKKESEDCTITYNAQGEFTIEAYPGPGNLMIHAMGALSEQLAAVKSLAPAGAFDTLIDRYLFAVTVPPQEIEGEKICRGKREVVKKRILGNKIQVHYKFNEDGRMSGENSWSSDFYPPTSDVSVSKLPPIFKAKPYSPEKTSAGEITYKLKWQIKEPAAVQIVRLDPNDPNDDGEDITDQSQKIDIGEKVLLKAFVYPQPKNQSTVEGKWSIPGKLLKDWQATHSNSTKTEIPHDDYTKDKIEFFWFDVKEGGEKHTISFKPDGRNAKGETTFEVQRPDISLVAGAAAYNDFHLGGMEKGDLLDEQKCCVTYSQEEKNDYKWCKDKRAELESLADSPSGSMEERSYKRLLTQYKEKCLSYGLQYKGITFYGRPLGKFDGELQYVQLIKINADSMGPTKSWGLDGCYPYPMNKPPYSTFDAPGFSDPGPGNTRHRDLSFKMYLMYRPKPKYKDAHAWVPMYKIDWGWGGKITCDANGDCRHGYEGDRFTPDPPTEPQHDYPEWHSCN
jgi:hypothetical protein